MVLHDHSLLIQVNERTSRGGAQMAAAREMVGDERTQAFATRDGLRKLVSQCTELLPQDSAALAKILFLLHFAPTTLFRRHAVFPTPLFLRENNLSGSENVSALAQACVEGRPRSGRCTHVFAARWMRVGSRVVVVARVGAGNTGCMMVLARGFRCVWKQARGEHWVALLHHHFLNVKIREHLGLLRKTLKEKRRIV